MSFLVGPLEDLFRFLHIGAAIIWVGLVHFMAFIRPKILTGLGEGTRKEVLPHLSDRLVPWLSWGSLVTVLAGILLYLHLAIRGSFAGVAMELNVGILLGLVMIGLTHGATLPGLRRVAQLKEGGAPPPTGLQERTHQSARISAFLSWLVLALMVLGGQ